MIVKSHFDQKKSDMAITDTSDIDMLLLKRLYAANVQMIVVPSNISADAMEHIREGFSKRGQTVKVVSFGDLLSTIVESVYE